jgi:hypothetical protein
LGTGQEADHLCEPAFTARDTDDKKGAEGAAVFGRISGPHIQVDYPISSAEHYYVLMRNL